MDVGAGVSDAERGPAVRAASSELVALGASEPHETAENDQRRTVLHDIEGIDRSTGDGLCAQ